MITTRRGFFGLLAGLAVCPLFGRNNRYAGPIEGYNYTFHYHNFVADDLVSSGNQIPSEQAAELWKHYNRVFVWEYTPGILYWSKEQS